MPPLHSVKVTDLQKQFQNIELLSPVGFHTALSILDQNFDHLIDDWEIFDVFGVERSCQEFTTMLGSTDSRFVPQTLYYGECLPSDEFVTPYDMDFCWDKAMSPNDTQVALDALMSLSFYLRSNRDVIEDLESTSLYYQCNLEIQQEDAPQEKSEVISVGRFTKQSQQGKPQEIVLGENTTLMLVDAHATAIDNESTNVVYSEADRQLMASIDSDPSLVDYFEDVCHRALTMEPADLEKSVAVIMFMDGLSGANPLHAYLSDNTNMILDCAGS